MSVDFAALRAQIRDAAEKAFAEVRESHPGEQFYAFALYTDDGAMTVEPAANSEEAYQQKIRQAGATSASQQAYYRWETAEWAYEAVGGNHFDGVYDALNVPDRYGAGAVEATVEPEEDENQEGDEAFDEGEEDEEFTAFKGRLIQTMTEALRDLDSAGFFGQGDERRKVTLFVSISDADQSTEIENASARKLNPEAVYEPFLRRYS